MKNEVLIQTNNGELKRLAGKIIWCLLDELMDERAKCGVGRRLAGCWLEAKTDGVYISVTAAKIEWHVDVGVVPGEARRGDTYDGVVFASELQALPHHVSVSVEVALPELVAEDNDRKRIVVVNRVCGQQAAAERRWDAKKLKSVRGHIAGSHFFRQLVT